MSKPLGIVPITRSEAQAFVTAYHRHHKPSVGDKFCIGVSDGDSIRGVAVVGRPVARGNDDGWTLEVTRCCTDGARNACSMLYRAARAMGYRRLITYTLACESGASLRGAGFRVVGEVRGRSWNTPSRPRVDLHPTQDKLRWELSA